MPTIVTKYDFLLQFIEDVVKQNGESSAIVICCNRAEFLEQLAIAIENPPILNDADKRKQAIPSSQDSDEDIQALHVLNPLEHPLLKPTLQLLAVSERVHLAFCPTIPILRAYLSVFPSGSSEAIQAMPAKIVIINLIALHHGTSEFTVQGMMRTLSLVASLAHRTQTDLRLMECKDVLDPTNPDRGSGLWDTPIRLLSGSIKLGEGGARWAGQTIAIRKIASRWFTFE